MPKPKFNKRTLQSLEQLAGLRQQLADQEFEALKAAQEAAAIRQQTAGKAAARASNILNNAKGVRQASTGRMHFTRGKSGSGIYVPITSSGKVNPSIASTETPLLAVKEVQMPTSPITGKIKIKSSTNPFVNVTQSMQNAYDMGLPGLQSAFQSDMAFMHAPLMQRLVDRTGRTAQSISKQINPETGQIYTNYFGVVEPNYAQWRRLHEMAGKDRPTAEQVEVMFQTPQMKTIFSRMQDLLGINPVEAKQVTIRKPYSSPQINIASNYIGPDMGPGIYGYHTDTGEWWPLTKRAAETAVGNTGKYSLFSAIGKNSLPIKIAHRHNVIEKGVNFEGDPFIVRYNAVSSNPEFYKAKQKIYWEGFQGRGDSGPDDWANSGSGSWKVRGKKQGGILSAKSGIHIKKANRGKFTDYCGGKVTSECIARGKASSNPAIRKRATFAANSRSWSRKHMFGGILNVPNRVDYD